LRYEKTRHNLGFMLVDFLAREVQTQVKREECRALVGRALIENEAVELVKPQTFMNLSGEAISCLLRKENRDAKKLIVVVDDLALPFGSIRLRPKGSAGGHNGLKSIIACLRTEEFIRLRIGIQPEHPVGDTKNFVLENFSRSDTEKLNDILERSAAAIISVIRDGIEKAMARWNADLGLRIAD
jgi:peptidyl-tRNA hydrolase, PTH1 family